MKKLILASLLLVFTTSALTGCENMSRKQKAALIGGAAGAGIGYAVGGGAGAAIGGVGGAIIGAGVTKNKK